MPVFLQGCSRPSQITVTGVSSLQQETQSDDRSDFVPGTGIYSPAEGVTDPDASKDDGSTAAKAPGAASRTDSDPSGGQIAVYVCGAVHKPGVCYLPAGARVCDALDAAGGFLDGADSQWLNQAKMLSDGEMLVAYTLEETAQMKEQGIARGLMAPEDAPEDGPGAGTVSGTAAGTDQSTGPDGGALINLNTASREQLMTLPGIGEAKADAIIRYRTETGLFASPEDVMNISGIKNSIYEKIRAHVTV